MSSLAAVRDQIQAAIGGLTHLEESQQILEQAEGLQKDIAELEHEKQDLILDICDAREELNVLSREAARVRSDLSQSQSQKEIEKVADETTKPQSTDNKKEEKAVSFLLESQAEEGGEETQDVSFLPETQMQAFQLEPDNKKEQKGVSILLESQAEEGDEETQDVSFLPETQTQAFQLESDNKKKQKGVSFLLESQEEDGDEETQDVSFLPENQMQAEEETQGSPFQLETQQQDASEDNEETQDVSFLLETQQPTTEDDEETQDASFLLEENGDNSDTETQNTAPAQDTSPPQKHNKENNATAMLQHNSDAEMRGASDGDTARDTVSPEQEHKEDGDADAEMTSEDEQPTSNEQTQETEGNHGPTRMIDDVDVREAPVQETDYSGDDEGDGPQIQPAVAGSAAARKKKRVRRVYRSPKTWRRMARNNRLRSVFLADQGNDLGSNLSNNN